MRRTPPDVEVLATVAAHPVSTTQRLAGQEVSDLTLRPAQTYSALVVTADTGQRWELGRNTTRNQLSGYTGDHCESAPGIIETAASTTTPGTCVYSREVTASGFTLPYRRAVDGAIRVHWVALSA